MMIFLRRVARFVVVVRDGLRSGGGEELSDDFVGVFLEEGELERVQVVGRAVEGDPVGPKRERILSKRATRDERGKPQGRREG